VIVDKMKNSKISKRANSNKNTTEIQANVFETGSMNSIKKQVGKG
jgi:hypothetical protein